MKMIDTRGTDHEVRFLFENDGDYVFVDGTKYEVMVSALEDLVRRTGKAFIECLEYLAHKVLISGEVRNEGYFRICAA